MDYSKIYSLIIERAKVLLEEREQKRKLRLQYYERHHIVPLCMEGTNDKDNKVNLTAKEHFICHRLLVLIYPTNSKLKYALWAISTYNNKFQQRHKVSARTYEKLKLEMSNEIGKLHTGSVRSEDWKRKQRESKKNQVPFNKGKKLEEIVGVDRAKEIKQQISNNTERNSSISRALKGREFSEQHKLHLRKPKSK